MQRASCLRRRLTLKTSSLGFAFWWFVLLVLHVVNLVYYVGVAAFYKEIQNTNLDFQLDTYSIGISFHDWGNVGGIHLVIAALHTVVIFLMVVGSLATRRLVFQPHFDMAWVPHCPVLASTYHKLFAHKVDVVNSADADSRQRQSLTDVYKLVVGSGNAIFGREGFLGVDSVYFDHLHLAREIIETTLQTIQAYRMTHLLSRVWLIRFYVVLLIANCWSTPILCRFYHNRHVERRMMSLLCDAVLDMVSSIGVSFWIFVTYLPQYTDPTFGFPFEVWFSDVWFTNMQQEFQMMLVVSWVDMASRLMFALGLLQCMDAMKDLLTPVSTQENTQSKSTTVVSSQSPSKRWAGPVAVLPSHPLPEEISTKSQNSLSLLTPRLVTFLLNVAGPSIFIVWGLLILCVHSVAESQYRLSPGFPCKLHLLPWFVSKPACSLVEIDCHALGELSGSLFSLEDAWNTYEPGATARLVIRHCVQLEIPSMIERFTFLSGLKIYNSTITSWSAGAALSEPAHANMNAIYLLRCHLPDGDLPLGFLTDQFPRKLKTFIVSSTNLMSLPTNLHELWPQRMTLSFEYTSITSIPDSIVQLHPMVLSFMGSPIATVPAEVFESPVLECLLLSSTNIQELPRMVAKPSSRWYVLKLQDTNVSTFWSWMDPFIEHSKWFQCDFFNAYNTPFCHALQAIVAGNASDFPSVSADPKPTDFASVMDVSTPERLAWSQQAVTCTPGIPDYFPIDLEDVIQAITN